MTSGIAVFDASPLIALHQIGHLALPHSLFLQSLVPPIVAAEVAPSLGTVPDWIDVRADFAVLSLARDLDAGELAAISLAMRVSADFVVLDDLAGRLTAAELGLTTVGSLGLLVRAKANGLIDEVRPLMDAMIVHGLYTGEGLYRLILSIAGEA